MRGYVEYIRHRAFDIVLEQRDKGVVHESLVSRLIELNGPADTVRDSTAFLYTVGKDTTTAAVLTAIRALLAHPEIQEKAHTELDLVVGLDHPPSAEDCSRLPYLEAIWKESIRWRPPVPLNIPHVSGEDDIWEGYWIPKGSFVFANIGFMLRDERIWENPESFYPERFLDPSCPPPFDPQSVIFGFGRRVCPGKYLADRQGFQILASILWAFRIDPIEGETRLQLQDVKFVDALVTPPLPFRCHFTPRNVNTAAYCVEDR